MNRTVRTAALLSVAALAMVGCAGGGDDTGDAATGSDGATTIVVGASPVPHAEILQFVQDELAADAGLDLQIEENGYEFDHFEGVHIEPYGVYSETVDSLADLPDGATIGLTNDPGNQGRALDLLVEAGLITLADTGEAPTLLDIEDNPKNLEFIETAPEQLVVSLPDVDAAVINGNFALEAGLNPASDAILLEAGEGNPYANLVAFRSQDAGDPALAKLDELLHSDEVRTFIEERWPDGEIIPAF